MPDNVSQPALDIDANRRSQKYDRSTQVRRVLWAVVGLLFRLSPRPLFGWRRLLLRAFGAQVGASVNVYPSTVIVMPWNVEIGDHSAIGEHALIYSLGPIRIGRRATISQRAHLCAATHDFRKRDLPLVCLPIEIGDDAWVCADAFVGPGVKVGEGAVVGARAVAVRDVLPWTVVAGNPAKQTGARTLDS
jgi:putative colanic acid biosynthesis acetyltransferase WcaF